MGRFHFDWRHPRYPDVGERLVHHLARTKVVIAVAQGATNPDAAALGAKAGLASRTNTLFSIPMLYFMAAGRHLQADVTLNPALLGALGVLIAALWINGLAGKTGPMTSVKGVITSGFVLTVVLYGMIEVLG